KSADRTFKWTGTDRTLEKWRPDRPTSPHWYTPEAFRSLIAAYVAVERDGGESRSVREFVSEFDGLTGSLKQKRVLEQANLSGARLEDLVAEEEVNAPVADRLLKTMALSPDGKVVASSCLGGTLRLWDTETGKEIRSLPIDSGARVLAMTFSPDSK